MRKVGITLTILVLLLFGGLQLFIHTNDLAQADVPPPVTDHNPSLEELVPLQEHLIAAAGNSAQISSNQVMTRSSLLGEEIITHPAIEEFNHLYQKFTSQYVHPGWLHLVYREDHPSNSSVGEALPNGTVIPSTFVLDSWYQLSESNQVFKGITLMYDQDGNLLQVSVYHELAWHNLTLNEVFTVESAPVIRLDAYFRSNMDNAINNGGSVSQETAVLDGREVLRFTFDIYYESPVLYGEMSQPIQQFRGHAYVDPVSGSIIMIENIVVTPSQTELVSLRSTLVMIESGKVPPDEILTYITNTSFEQIP